MGGRRGKRTRIATGVYKDAYGYGVIVRGKEHRYPPATAEGTLRKTRRELLDNIDARVTRFGTLADDVVTYLAALPADITTGIERRRRKSDAETLLNHWLTATTLIEGTRVTFGSLPRAAITSLMIRTQLAAWRSAGIKEGTCDHRRRELGTLYNILNGKEGYNPVRAVPKFAPTYDDPRGFDPAVMKLIVDSMPDRGRPEKGSTLKDGTIPTINQAKLRLRVMLACGIPPQTLKKVTPADITLHAKTVMTRQRRKGDGAKGRLLPLTTAAADALKAFAAANLFGWFDQRAVNRSFKRAAKRYRATWHKEHPGEPCPVPDDLHAYDTRHTFASDVFRRTGNKKAVAHLLGQTENSPMADRYVQAAVDDVARAAIAAVESASMPLPRSSKKYAKIPINRSAKPVHAARAKTEAEP